MTIEEQRLKVSLTEHIQKWMEQAVESDDDWSAVAHYCYTDLTEDMAKAAFTVFLACHKGQQFANDQEP